jgi:hypothetical protein
MSQLHEIQAPKESSTEQTKEQELKYLMAPELFESLSFVQGFNRLNGKTYQQHITMALSISSDLREQIHQETDYDKLMELLKNNGYNITHSMDFNNS